MELIGSARVAAMLGVGQHRVNQLARGENDFPAPLAVVARHRLWDADAVRAWIKANHTDDDDQQAS